MKLLLTEKAKSRRVDQVFKGGLNVEMSIRTSSENVSRYLDIVVN